MNLIYLSFGPSDTSAIRMEIERDSWKDAQKAFPADALDLTAVYLETFKMMFRLNSEEM